MENAVTCGHFQFSCTNLIHKVFLYFVVIYPTEIFCKKNVQNMM